MSELTSKSARPKTVGVNLKRVINLGDYNSLSIGTSIEIEVGSEKLDDVYKRAFAECSRQIEKYALESGVVD